MGVDIVIATPGRLLSYIKLGLIDLSQVKYFILDEADRMLDMGFIDDIMLIIKELPKRRQTMLFSATMPSKIRELAKKIMQQPKEIRLAVSRPNENIDQSAYICYEQQKPELVNILFGSMQIGEKVLIFASSKIKVKEVCRILKRLKLSVIEMHSDLEQAEREKVMHSFKNGKVQILVATDIVSRGIDIDDIALVINYDVPHDPEDYVHRIGRTARAGEKGKAITFVSEQDQYDFLQIERFLEKEVVKHPLPSTLGEAPLYKPQKGGRSRFISKLKEGGRKGNSGAANKKSGPRKPFKGGARSKQ